MWTIEAIKEANRNAGKHYFDTGTMQFFRSRVLSYVFEGSKGVYFVTSEKNKGMLSGTDYPRRYTVRKFNPEDATVDTFGPFNKVRKDKALRAARIAAEYPEAALEYLNN